MDADKAKKLQEQLASYNLTDRLFDRLQVVIDGGCAKTTMYKAFRVGSKTPLLNRILATAEEVLRSHEELIGEYVAEPAAA